MLIISFPKLQLSHVVSVCNSYLNQKIKNVSSFYSDFGIFFGLQMAKILYESNERLPRVELCHFYNSSIDFLDLWLDFECLEKKNTMFAICQYPFLITLGSKSKIFETEISKIMASLMIVSDF